MTSMPLRRLSGALLTLWVLAIAGAVRADTDEDAVKPVKLAAEIQAKLGLASQPLMAKTAAATVAGFIRVLDPGPLAQLDADIQTAEAAAHASVAEAARSKALNADGQAVSTKALQAAQAQAEGDAAKLALLRRRLGLEWGEGLARLSDRQRSQLLAQISSGKAALVRIDTPSGQGLARLRGVDIDLGGLGSVHARVLGAARAADPHLLSPGLIAKASGANTRFLGVGLAVPVKLTTAAAVTGVVAPRDALLRSQGKTWVYVRTGAESFLRKPVEDARPDDKGLFAPAGLQPGQQVVTRGAAALFAAETNVGDAGGD
jgi:hypothetical protein